jgi:hypothetical protein
MGETVKYVAKIKHSGVPQFIADARQETRHLRGGCWFHARGFAGIRTQGEFFKGLAKLPIAIK